MFSRTGTVAFVALLVAGDLPALRVPGRFLSVHPAEAYPSDVAAWRMALQPTGSALVVIHMCQQPTGRSKLTRRAARRGGVLGFAPFLRVSASPRDTFLLFFCPGLGGGKQSSLLEKNQTENVSSEIVSRSRWLFFSLFHGIGAYMCITTRAPRGTALPGDRDSRVRRTLDIVSVWGKIRDAFSREA